MKRQRNPVTSSNVKSVGYDEKAKVLEIEFKNGSVYSYKDVPKETYDGLMETESVGGYVASSIRGVYECEQIQAPEKKRLTEAS